MADLSHKKPTRGLSLETAWGPKPTSFLSANRVVVYAILGLVSMVWLMPMYVMLMTSLKDMAEIRLGNIFSVPLHPTVEPWTRAWSSTCTGLRCEGVSQGFWNSVRITVPAVAISVGLASINGYALSFWRFKGANIFFAVLVFGAFIPYQVLIYPMVVMMREARLYGSYWGLILAHVAFSMPIITLIFRNYFSTIPLELFKAARIDGAGFWGIYLRIMVPMSTPIFVVAIIIQFTSIWNDFLLGVVFARPETYPMTVQLNNIVNTVEGVREFNLNMAATILTGLIPLIIYVASGKFFVRGIAAGAVKG